VERASACNGGFSLRSGSGAEAPVADRMRRLATLNNDKL